jgi:hypothetical protein
MKTFYLLVADNGWAKLYKSDYSPEQLTLIYHQRNLTGWGTHVREAADPEYAKEINSQKIEDESFAKSLCKILKADFKAGKFNALVVLSSNNFIDLIRRHLDSQCHSLMQSETVPSPSQLTKQDLLSSLRKLVRAQLLAGIPAGSINVKKTGRPGAPD